MPKLPARRADSPPAGYAELLDHVKSRIIGARTRAVLAVNSALIELYWAYSERSSPSASIETVDVRVGDLICGLVV
jgi:hypothetical protein